MVAAGRLDVAILTLGGVWDFAATRLIVARGGRCVPRRVGRRAVRHGDRSVHQRGPGRPGAGGAGRDAPADARPRSSPARPARRSATRTPAVTSGVVRDPPVALDVGARSRRGRAARGPRHRGRACRPAGRAVRRRHHRRCGARGLRSFDAPKVDTGPSPMPRSAFSRRSRATTPPGDVHHGRGRVADVDQRPHEPLPPRRDAGGSRAPDANWHWTCCAPRCRRAVSVRPAR